MKLPQIIHLQIIYVYPFKWVQTNDWCYIVYIREIKRKLVPYKRKVERQLVPFDKQSDKN